MRAASQLPERGPTDVDIAPYLHVNKKSDDVDDCRHIIHTIYIWMERHDDKT